MRLNPGAPFSGDDYDVSKDGLFVYVVFSVRPSRQQRDALRDAHFEFDGVGWRRRGNEDGWRLAREICEMDTWRSVGEDRWSDLDHDDVYF